MATVVPTETADLGETVALRTSTGMTMRTLIGPRRTLADVRKKSVDRVALDKVLAHLSA